VYSLKKCRFCEKPAIVRLEYANLRLCEEHFKQYYVNRIKRILEKHRIRGKLLVAVSGGKDSMSLLHALSQLNDIDMEITAFHIDLGIFDYSKKSREVVREFAKQIGVVLIIYDLKREIGFTVPELAQAGRRPPCAVCGIVKRWVLNKVAYENGFDFIATGHNIDDVSTIFLKALLTQDIYTIIRAQSEFSPSKMDIKLVGRIRPQYYLSEMENRLYVELNGIPVVEEQCPLSMGATIHKYRTVWDTLLKINPVSQINLVRSILKLRKGIPIEEQRLLPCKKCGYPTESKTGICAFCRLIEKAKKTLGK